MSKVMRYLLFKENQFDVPLMFSCWLQVRYISQSPTLIKENQIVNVLIIIFLTPT